MRFAKQLCTMLLLATMPFTYVQAAFVDDIPEIAEYINLNDEPALDYLLEQMLEDNEFILALCDYDGGYAYCLLTHYNVNRDPRDEKPEDLVITESIGVDGNYNTSFPLYSKVLRTNAYDTVEGVQDDLETFAPKSVLYFNEYISGDPIVKAYFSSGYAYIIDMIDPDHSNPPEGFHVLESYGLNPGGVEAVPASYQTTTEVMVDRAKIDVTLPVLLSVGVDANNSASYNGSNYLQKATFDIQNNGYNAINIKLDSLALPEEMGDLITVDAFEAIPKGSLTEAQALSQVAASFTSGNLYDLSTDDSTITIHGQESAENCELQLYMQPIANPTTTLFQSSLHWLVKQEGGM